LKDDRVGMHKRIVTLTFVNVNCYLQ